MKHLTKLAAVFLALAMLFTVAGCGTGGESSTGGEAANTNNADFKVGVIHIGDPADGAGYSYAHDLGIVDMQAALKLTDEQVIRKINVNDTDAVATRTAIEECIEEGCKIIFGTSWGYMDTMEQLAAEYPDIVFSHGTGYKSNGTNFNNYFGRIYQARYLSGIAAGLKTQTDKIGYVAAMGITNSEVTGGVNAFAMGVESVNPDAKIYVKVTESWFSPDLEKQAAEALLDAGCDVISQHCDTTAPQLAAQSRGVWGVGYNSDMTKDAPQAHLTAPIWNWGVYYTKAAKAVLEGTWDGANYYGGMDDGLVDISPLSENCAEGTKEKIEEARAKIMDGSFKVFEGELFDNAGNQVCKAGEVISDADITGAMNWYYRNVEVK
ncbi:MAG: BMP family ABC transporter substrate-binding protein [Ruminococcaceae bacterium]|nr:BMP family ABC transporter substrate-binding protein [Oscillospiraceae bacterium]